MTRTPAREAESLPCPSLLGVGTYPTLFPPVLQAPTGASYCELTSKQEEKEVGAGSP